MEARAAADIDRCKNCSDMRTKTKQVFGKDLHAEGYLNDSMGIGIDPGGLYEITFIEYTEIKTIYRVGVGGKRKAPVELKKVSRHVES